VGLRVLEAVCQRLESGGGVDAAHIEEIIEFIKGYADRCHHFKEEDLLFEAMEKAGFPRHAGPLGVMLAEHDMGRGYVRGMSDAVASYKLGDRKVVSVIVKNARNYISLLTAHIAKEDNVLYPMADQRLSEEQQRELAVQFEKVDGEKIGLEKLAQFHEILTRLENIYLG
jgi:hemerythrin-like domain-containing protein